MSDESFSNSQTFTTTKKTIERHSIYDNDNSSLNNNKSRKFRWSSCFSFVTKFKKPKSQKIRLSQSFEDFDQSKDYVPENNLLPAETIQVVEVVKPSTGTSPWKQQPSSSLSPPPRHIKNKRDSSISHKNYQSDIDNTVKGGRRPLVDPTLTPRVKPRSIKTKNQPFLLRLSLDAELLQQSSPDGVFSLHHDNESISTCKTGHSSASFTPTTTQLHPFRSGTLGAMKNPKLSMSSTDSEIPPPLPQINIPLEIVINSSSNNTRPNSQATTTTNNSNISQHFADSPVSISAVEVPTTTDDEEKLTLKERRHRRSPLSMPDTDQLTLALKDLLTVEQPEEEEEVAAPEQQQQKSVLPRPHQPRKRHTSQVYYESGGNEEDHVWRQQLLEQSIAFSFQDKSRQEAMLTLEGKKSRAISLRPIVNVHDLDDHFDDNGKRDVVKDKAQYDAIVSRTTMHRRQLSHDERNRNNNRTSLHAQSPSDSSTNEKKILLQHQNEMLVISPQLDSITENEIATTSTPISTNKTLLFPTNGPHLSVTPETPPHHQQNAPSLISAPSTPNSIDSSVLDHDDYMSDRHQQQHHHLTLIQSSQ